MRKTILQKIYCYVDETGQDIGSDFAIVNDKDQELLRCNLMEIESQTKIGKRKWHKTQTERNMQYLQVILKKEIGKGEVYFGHYKKPIPYFLPMLEILEKSIQDKIKGNYKAIVYVDGIDKKKAMELTNALRVRKIKLELVRSVRDESEPLIRMADRWAGCVRGAFLGKKEEKEIFDRAKNKNYLHKI